MRSLVKAARSVLLYEASNQAVRDFLVDVEQRVTRFLAREEELALVVRPWDMTFGGEVVYFERDRERSLSLRLYRDGVRKLTIRRGVPWDELYRLVTILSLRFKGLRQQEEDAVTMLWKAGFSLIDVDSVAGFVADDDEAPLPAALGEGEPGVQPKSAQQAVIFSAPYEFAYPPPRIGERAAVVGRPLSAAARARIQEEDGEAGLAGECLQLVRECLNASLDPVDPLRPDEVAPAIKEIRDFLVSSGHDVELVALVETVYELLPQGNEEARRELMLACLDDHALRRFAGLETGASVVPAAGGAAPVSLDPRTAAAVRRLAGLLTRDHLAALLDALAKLTASQAARPPAFDVLLEGAARRHPAQVRERAVAASTREAIALLTLLRAVSPEDAAQAAADLIQNGDEDVQLAALEALKGAPAGARLGRALVAALGAGSEAVRLGAMQLLVRLKERRAFAPLAERLRQLPVDNASQQEATACGVALALLDPAEALKVFRDIVRPAGLLQRVIPRQPILQWAAASGLARIAGDDAESLLGHLAAHGGDDLRQRCQDLLARRQGGGEAG